MKIIVWSINYAPEATGIGPCNAALCNFLRLRGHTVQMLTSFAYYPAWKKRSADRGTWYRTDEVNGVEVHRCWHYVPRRPGAVTRILHEASFVFTSLLRLLTLSRPDVYVVVSPPLLLGAAAWLLTRIKSAPFVFHVQDLQPDGAMGLGMLKLRPLLRILLWLETLAYRKAALVSGVSHGMLTAFGEKRVPREKTVYFPNGAILPRPGRCRPREGFARATGFQHRISSCFIRVIWASSKDWMSCWMRRRSFGFLVCV